MPNLTPRAVAHHAGVTYLLAYHGKARHLMILDGAALRPVRELPGSAVGTFWISGSESGPVAVFGKLGGTLIVPLDPPKAKAKTLELEGNAFFDFKLVLVGSESRDMHGVLGKSVYRFDGDHWTNADGAMSPAVAIWSNLRGTYRRPLIQTAADWKPLVEQQVVRPVLAVTDDGKRVFVGSHGGVQRLIDADGDHETLLELPSTWDAVGLADRFVIWNDRKISELALDGKRIETAVTGEPHQDNCLFRARDFVYFAETTRLHVRAPSGTWTKIDVAALGAAIGLA
jgi:hypothetical protein